MKSVLACLAGSVATAAIAFASTPTLARDWRGWGWAPSGPGYGYPNYYQPYHRYRRHVPDEPNNKQKPSANSSIADIANGQPMMIVISLDEQKVDVYRGTTRVGNSQVSSGMPGYATPAGVFSILEKQRLHESNIYSGAPMPWMQRITWSGMANTGALTDGLVKVVYEAAGTSEPSNGHLFVRQAFDRLFDTPVDLKDADRPLGTYVFTALNFAPSDTKTQWVAIAVEGADAASTLDRLKIPDDIRQKISQRLTPGSTLIVADTGINSAILPKGGDFVVLAKDTSKVAKGITDQPSPGGRRYFPYPPYYPQPRSLRGGPFWFSAW